jgi:hypothetical protein
MSLPALLPAQVQINYHFEHPELARVLLPTMEREVTRILQIGLAWRPQEEASKHSAHRPANIEFFGRCSVIGPEIRSRGYLDEPLGWTHTMMGGEVIPYSAVDCDRIRALLGPELLHARDPQATYAIAVARVAAHELVHSLLSEKGHTRAGLMQRCFRVPDLIGDRLDLDSPHAHAIAKLVW